VKWSIVQRKVCSYAQRTNPKLAFEKTCMVF
jgi:hypothetical protein